MPIAYLVTWTEYERGWGQRPDGYSLFPSKEAWTAFKTTFEASKLDKAPDEYSNPNGEPVAVEVNEMLAEKLAVEGHLRYWNNDLVIDIGETGVRVAHEREPTRAKTFIQLCLEKKTSPDQIDDFVERWHTGKAGKGLELREFLGMSKEEYAEFMKDPASLYKTLYAHL